MGKVTILHYTSKDPISMIGYHSGVCYGSDVSNEEKNYKRGLDCLESQHGRTWEFPSVHMTIEGYSARFMRELYTHIGGAPTRVQASTRYINYKDFDYYTPPSILNHHNACSVYQDMMGGISYALNLLESYGIPKEDSANGLPLGMESKMVGKYNPRTLIDMSHQRKCVRAYHEYREFFKDLEEALSEYSDQWKFIVDNFFMAKCEFMMYCPEKSSCGRYPRKEVVESFIQQWREEQKKVSE